MPSNSLTETSLSSFDPRPLPMYTIPVDRNQNVVRSSKLITTEKNKESDNTEKK